MILYLFTIWRTQTSTLSFGRALNFAFFLCLYLNQPDSHLNGLKHFQCMLCNYALMTILCKNILNLRIKQIIFEKNSKRIIMPICNEQFKLMPTHSAQCTTISQWGQGICSFSHALFPDANVTCIKTQVAFSFTQPLGMWAMPRPIRSAHTHANRPK